MKRRTIGLASYTDFDRFGKLAVERLPKIAEEVEDPYGLAEGLDWKLTQGLIVRDFYNFFTKAATSRIESAKRDNFSSEQVRHLVDLVSPLRNYFPSK